MQLCFFLMQYRSFVNNSSIDKLQICIKRSVQLTLRNTTFERKQALPFFVTRLYSVNLSRCRCAWTWWKSEPSKNTTSFSSVFERLFVSPTIISASLVPANETHLWEQNCHENQGCCVGDCLDTRPTLLRLWNVLPFYTCCQPYKSFRMLLWKLWPVLYRSDLLRLEMRALNDSICYGWLWRMCVRDEDCIHIETCCGTLQVYQRNDKQFRMHL